MRVASLLLAAALLATTPAYAQRPAAAPRVGPAHGTVIIAGGGQLGPEILQKFIELAGGAQARIVVLPTASEQDTFPSDWGGFEPLRVAGVADFTILHTRDRAEADSEAFVKPLQEATGVWIPGGRQWRLSDAYLDTRTHRELEKVLERGGVIGGTSAGASAQASLMLRGAVEGNDVVLDVRHARGFGFLHGVAVDQHLLARHREHDLVGVIARHPLLLGIGLDEGAAMVIQGDRAEVIGRSVVAIYNAADSHGQDYYFLRPGDVFDLAHRRAVRGTHPLKPSR